MQQAPQANPPGTLDTEEIDRFARLSREWWDPRGKFRALHRIGPARLAFLRDELVGHFGRSGAGKVGLQPLQGLSVLDVGCGGGLIAEPLARMGARVTGLDPAVETIEAARRHAAGQGLDITYRAGRVEALAVEGLAFDAVVCLEVLEHVPDAGAFLAACAAVVRPDGLLLLSTLNRTLKAYLLAIVGGEYVLRWLPVGTHRWERFITPDELSRYLRAAGFSAPTIRGLVYSPLLDVWSLATDTDVNYLASSAKPA
jgi:2-polyprenyl-6-hydroxyphenyl methylase/3-demethylubiquinone-9 3-methyltransferase